MSEQPVIRVIIHSLPWPNDQRMHPAAELKWRVTLGDETLIEASKRPYEDAAAILAHRGEDPETLYTMRHAHLSYDSFVPRKLADAAKPGLKRMESAEKMRAYFAKMKEENATVEDEDSTPEME